MKPAHEWRRPVLAQSGREVDLERSRLARGAAGLQWHRTRQPGRSPWDVWRVFQRRRHGQPHLPGLAPSRHRRLRATGEARKKRGALKKMHKTCRIVGALRCALAATGGVGRVDAWAAFHVKHEAASVGAITRPRPRSWQPDVGGCGVERPQKDVSTMYGEAPFFRASAPQSGSGACGSWAYGGASLPAGHRFGSFATGESRRPNAVLGARGFGSRPSVPGGSWAPRRCRGARGFRFGPLRAGDSSNLWRCAWRTCLPTRGPWGALREMGRRRCIAVYVLADARPHGPFNACPQVTCVEVHSSPWRAGTGVVGHGTVGRRRAPRASESGSPSDAASRAAARFT